jgi:ribonuclease Z
MGRRWVINSGSRMDTKLTITAFSTALFSTWIFVEEFNILFDAGDGVAAGLGLKSRKAESIFISHADRDHLAGLLQLHQLNAREGLPHIYYPLDCGSFSALRDFMARFDPQAGPATWHPLGANEEVSIANNMLVRARTNAHVVKPGSVKSLDFTLCQTRRKLNANFTGLPGQEIAALRAAHGDDYVTELQIRPILGYSGDAPALEPIRWQGVEVLVHEATFLTDGEARGAHANLPQVLAAAAKLDVRALILSHFSPRYAHDEIRAAIHKHAQEYALPFPVYAILPGQVVYDVLASEPCWRA